MAKSTSHKELTLLILQVHVYQSIIVNTRMCLCVRACVIDDDNNNAADNTKIICQQFSQLYAALIQIEDNRAQYNNFLNA